MKKFFIKSLLFSLIVLFNLSIIVLVNFKFDPYGVLNGNMETQKIEPNQHYLKIKHLIENPVKYDSYVFGSSRAGKLDTRNIKDVNRWYNLSYSEGVPLEHLDDIKIMIDKGVKIKNIFVTLDNISLYIDPENNKKHSFKKPYVNKYEPYYEYLLMQPDPFVLKKSRQVFKAGEAYVWYDIYNSGVPIVVNQDSIINSDVEKHRTDKVFEKGTWGGAYNYRGDKVLKTVIAIISLCEKNSIDVKFAITPMHVKTYLMQDMDHFFDFYKKLSKITDFFDFSGINEITTNNYNYYETSHYRPFIGDEIIKVVLRDEASNFGVFGVYVTENNVDSMLEYKMNEVEIYNSKKLE